MTKTKLLIEVTSIRKAHLDQIQFAFNHSGKFPWLQQFRLAMRPEVDGEPEADVLGWIDGKMIQNGNRAAVYWLVKYRGQFYLDLAPHLDSDAGIVYRGLAANIRVLTYLPL